MHYKSFSINQRTTYLVDYPTECPECHQKTTPNHNAQRITSDHSKVYTFLSCPNPNCDKSYVAEYEKRENHFFFKLIVKGQPRKEIFPSEIEILSPSFIKIYNESFTAEQIGLLEISGVGYRKAIEFLIKDYLISNQQNTGVEIKGMSLGNCIKDLVVDSKIKESAKRAVWLGNDQTHYHKRWEDKDLIDLKKLIRLTVNWVESEILTSDLTNMMPE